MIPDETLAHLDKLADAACGGSFEAHLIGTELPALIAEVRRLREEVAFARCAGCGAYPDLNAIEASHARDERGVPTRCGPVHIRARGAKEKR